MKKYIYIVSVSLMFIFFGCSGKKVYDKPYFGEDLPGIKPKLFAPEVVSTGIEESVITFMPDGKECYWSVSVYGIETILTCRLINHKWTKPEIASFAGQYHDGWPSVQPDGKRMFFHSNRPNNDSSLNITAQYNIWYMDRTPKGWGKPKILPNPINDSAVSSCPSITKDGTLYFSKWYSEKSEMIVKSRFLNDEFQKLEVLPEEVNASQFNFHGIISPSETYIVRPMAGRDDAIGRGWNYYVSFRDEAGNWSELINLGKNINELICRGSLSFSPDGKYLFFSASTSPKRPQSLDKRYSLEEILAKELLIPENGKADIYWVSTKVIEQLKPGDI